MQGDCQLRSHALKQMRQYEGYEPNVLRGCFNPDNLQGVHTELVLETKAV